MNNRLSAAEAAAQVAAWARKNADTPAARAQLVRQVFDGACDALRPGGGAPVLARLRLEHVLEDDGYLFTRYLRAGRD